MRAFLAVLSLCFCTSALACSGPACCVRYGVAAVCRSPIIEARAKSIVLRRCPRCDVGAVTDWIFSYQMNRGPYASAGDLARDVYCALKGCSY